LTTQDVTLAAQSVATLQTTAITAALNHQLVSPPYYRHVGVIASGPPSFITAVGIVLHELAYYALPRYQEAVRYLPWVHYCPETIYQMHPERHVAMVLGRRSTVAANAAGFFNDDGSDYERFRQYFLHEVGHNVHREQYGDLSEQAADLYRAQVEWELETAKRAVGLA
jgi:hypothetical protein